MLIGQRLKKLRESKNLSQGDVEKRTGLLRFYTSRVENGHTVPSVETLEKYARALEIPLYRFFHDSDKPPQKLGLLTAGDAEPMWGAKESERRELCELAKSLSRMNDRQRKLLLGVAQQMARRVRN